MGFRSHKGPVCSKSIANHDSTSYDNCERT